MAVPLSVLMPVYNAEKYLVAAVDSVLRQTFHDFELLVMDDGSTDATPALLARLAAHDPRISVFLRPRQGQIACRNELLHLARGDLVACADADDICLPDRLEQQLRAMSEDSSLWVLGTAMISIDARGRRRRPRRVITGSDAVAAELELRCCIGHPSCIMRRPNILGIGGYRPAYEAAEDYDLFLRASEHGKVDNLASAGVLYREHDESVSRRDATRQWISTDLARASHCLRMAGSQDPTGDLLAPPTLEAPIVAALIPAARIELHRAMAVTTDPDASAAEINRALRYLLSTRINKKQARAVQRAIVNLVVRRRPDRFSLSAMLRAVALGPGRLARLLWGRVRPAQTPPGDLQEFSSNIPQLLPKTQFSDQDGIGASQPCSVRAVEK